VYVERTRVGATSWSYVKRSGREWARSGRTCMRDGFTTMYGHPDGTDDARLQRIYARP
jgi:hypothetical protein